jgi:diacylglycerol kinase family enzyme
MAYALWAAFWRLPVFHGQMFIEGVEQLIESPFMMIGNNRYTLESLGILSRNALHAGQLNLFYIRRPSRWALIKIVIQAMLMQQRDAVEIKALTTTQASITSRKKSLRLTVDGEVITLPAPLQFRIWPGALQVVAPSYAFFQK